jgi:hypothetical protein
VVLDSAVLLFPSGDVLHGEHVVGVLGNLSSGVNNGTVSNKLLKTELTDTTCTFDKMTRRVNVSSGITSNLKSVFSESVILVPVLNGVLKFSTLEREGVLVNVLSAVDVLTAD